MTAGLQDHRIAGHTGGRRRHTHQVDSSVNHRTMARQGGGGWRMDQKGRANASSALQCMTTRPGPIARLIRGNTSIKADPDEENFRRPSESGSQTFHLSRASDTVRPSASVFIKGQMGKRLSRKAEDSIYFTTSSRHDVLHSEGTFLSRPSQDSLLLYFHGLHLLRSGHNGTETDKYLFINSFSSFVLTVRRSLHFHKFRS